MTANKPMTGEQLDELMTVAVNMQRDAETDCNRPSAMFAYAVQVAVLELRKVRNDASALAAENANARNAVQTFCDVVGANTDAICEEVGQDGVKAILAAMIATGNMPATDAFLAEVREQGIKIAINKLVALAPRLDKRAVETLSMAVEHLRKGVQS